MNYPRLINSAEIAYMAKVKRATVSMWKTRYDDFPEPVTHKLYNYDEILEWLARNEKGNHGIS